MTGETPQKNLDLIAAMNEASLFTDPDDNSVYLYRVVLAWLTADSGERQGGVFVRSEHGEDFGKRDQEFFRKLADRHNLELRYGADGVQVEATLI